MEGKSGGKEGMKGTGIVGADKAKKGDWIGWGEWSFCPSRIGQSITQSVFYVCFVLQRLPYVFIPAGLENAAINIYGKC